MNNTERIMHSEQEVLDLAAVVPREDVGRNPD